MAWWYLCDWFRILRWWIFLHHVKLIYLVRGTAINNQYTARTSSRPNYNNPTSIYSYPGRKLASSLYIIPPSRRSNTTKQTQVSLVGIGFPRERDESEIARHMVPRSHYRRSALDPLLLIIYTEDERERESEHNSQRKRRKKARAKGGRETRGITREREKHGVEWESGNGLLVHVSKSLCAHREVNPFTSWHSEAARQRRYRE